MGFTAPLAARRFMLAAALFAACAEPAEEAPPARPQPPRPDATLEISAKSLAAGVGYSWGRGTLDYAGQTYGVTMDGVTVIAVGFHSVTAKGSVFNMLSLDDFDGDYVATPGGRTLGEGGAGVAMKNEKGVEVRLVSETQGVTFTLGAGKVKLALVK
jgi:hypothetical protein